MPLKGDTQATTSLNVKSSIDVQPTELKINPSGKVTLSLPAMRIKMPDVKMKLWFMPFIRVSGMEITTAPANLEVDLSDTVMAAQIDNPTKIDILTDGEVKVAAKLEGSGSLQGGPISLEI